MTNYDDLNASEKYTFNAINEILLIFNDESRKRIIEMLYYKYITLRK